MKKLSISLLSIIIFLMISAIILSAVLVNGAFVAGLLADELGDDFEVTVEDAGFNPLTLKLNISGASIDRVTREQEESLLQFDRAVLSGIGILSTLNGNLSARHFLLSDFYLDADALQRGFDTGRLSNRSAELDIRSVELRNGTITTSAGKDGQGELQVNLKGGPVSIPAGDGEGNIWSGIRSLEADISAIDYSAGDGIYSVHGEDIRISMQDETMEIGSLTLEPNYDHDEFLEIYDFQKEYIRFELTGLIARQVQMDALRDYGDILAGSVVLDSMDLHVTLDKRLPEDPDAGTAVMPAQALRDISRRVAVDSIKIRHGDIYYSEYAVDGERPGTVLFAETAATLAGVDNRSEQTAHFTARTLLERSGELMIEIGIPQGEGEIISEVRGSMGEFDVPLLNTIFMDLEGMRFNDGLIHELEFAYTMRKTVSEGEVGISYEQLSVDMIDKMGHGQDITHVARSFFTDNIVIRAASNDESGRIYQERDERKSYFNYLWTSLRSGILDIVQRF